MEPGTWDLCFFLLTLRTAHFPISIAKASAEENKLKKPDTLIGSISYGELIKEKSLFYLKPCFKYIVHTAQQLQHPKLNKIVW